MNIAPLITISRNKAVQYDGLYVKSGWYVYKPGFFNARKSLRIFFSAGKKGRQQNEDWDLKKTMETLKQQNTET